jgi:hypothetical protein
MSRADIFKVSGTTAEQRARWRDAAGGGDRDLSAWIRRGADRAAASQADRGLTQADFDGLVTAITEFRQNLGSGPGNRLNQVARALNADIKAGVLPSAAPHEQVLAKSYEELQAIRAALNLALDRLDDVRP